MSSVTSDLMGEDFEGLSPATRNIYTHLRLNGPMTRSDLATVSGVTKETVTASISELRKRDLADWLYYGDTEARKRAHAKDP